MTKEYMNERKISIATFATTVFSSKGFHQATMKDVMEAAGVSRGGLYSHFNNIDEVFLETLKLNDSKHIANFNIQADANPVEQLLIGIDAILNSLLEDQNNLSKAIAEFLLLHDMDDIPYLKIRYNTLLDHMKEIVIQGIKEDYFSNNLNVEVFCKLIISTIDGVMLHYSTYPTSKEMLNQTIDLMKTMITNTVIKKEVSYV